MSHTHDWIESARRLLYPRLHPWLVKVGGYGTGTVTDAQHVATIHMDESSVEEYLLHAPHRFERNPVAAYKTTPDGRQSTLSLRLTAHGSSHYNSDYVESGMQLHWTFFEAADGALDLYAHYEDDWQVSPLKHLRGTNLDVAEGRRRSEEFLENATNLDRGDDYITHDN